MTENIHINEQILAEIKLLNANISELVTLLKDSKKSKIPRTKATQILNLTPEQIPALQDKFDTLYDRWRNNFELEVKQELESLSTDELRLLADANNLNVSAKTGRAKILSLISMRFKEKKLLNVNITRSAKVSGNIHNLANPNIDEINSEKA